MGNVVNTGNMRREVRTRISPDDGTPAERPEEVRKQQVALRWGGGPPSPGIPSRTIRIVATPLWYCFRFCTSTAFVFLTRSRLSRGRAKRFSPSRLTGSIHSPARRPPRRSGALSTGPVPYRRTSRSRPRSRPPVWPGTRARPTPVATRRTRRRR